MYIDSTHGVVHSFQEHSHQIENSFCGLDDVYLKFFFRQKAMLLFGQMPAQMGGGGKLVPAQSTCPFPFSMCSDPLFVGCHQSVPQVSIGYVGPHLVFFFVRPWLAAGFVWAHELFRGYFGAVFVFDGRAGWRMCQWFRISAECFAATAAQEWTFFDLLTLCRLESSPLRWLAMGGMSRWIFLKSNKIYVIVLSYT